MPETGVLRPAAAPSPLPPLYAEWMRDVLPGLSGEPEATCDRCAMLRTSPEEHGVFFHPATKCCTYRPSLPNFLAGRVLADESRAGARARAVLRQRLAERAGAFPLGVSAPTGPDGRPEPRAGVGEFGLNPDLRCPYHDADGGTCGIWPHRDAACATWFCKHAQGLRGLRAWRLLRRLFEHLQDELAIWCALELDLGDEAVVLLSPHLAALSVMRAGSLGGDETHAVSYDAAWGRWRGRQEAFYVECARLVEGLSWNDVKRATGSETEIFEIAARRAHEALRDESLPRVARPREILADRFGPGVVGFRTYSPYDPVDLPLKVVGVLHHFAEAPVEEALRRIRRDGLALGPADVRRLLDFGVLEAEDEAGRGGVVPGEARPDAVP